MAVAPVKRVLRPLWFEDLEPRLNCRWLIEDVLPQVGVGLLFGHPGCGKSFLSLDLALHVVTLMLDDPSVKALHYDIDPVRLAIIGTQANLGVTQHATA